MNYKIKVSAPLPLDGAKNVRDLGGYTCAGGITKTKMFLRSDGLHMLTDRDREYLYDYGVRCVIDLRSSVETDMHTSRMKDYRDVEYINISLNDNMQAENFKKTFPKSMGAMYINLLEYSQDQLQRIFASMARYPNDCVLFNCRAGKDRTGTVAMLILKLAGVDDDTVAEDYGVTEENMKELFESQMEELRQLIGEFPEYLFMSKKEDMYEALNHLYKNYGTAEEYLHRIGITDDEMNILKEKITGDSR